MAIVIPSRKLRVNKHPNLRSEKRHNGMPRAALFLAFGRVLIALIFVRAGLNKLGTRYLQGIIKMRKELLTALAASSLALGFAGSPVLAQDTVRVRGTIEKVEANALMVKSRDGRELKVVPADNAVIVAIVKASTADIKQGSFVGVTGMPQTDGSQR
jgi:hypothetical protein